MKKLLVSSCWLLVVVSCWLLIGSSYAQQRDAGQAVVPKGWESEDSIRFGVWNIKDAANQGGPIVQSEALADSLQSTFEYADGPIKPYIGYTGQRKGYMGYADTLKTWKPSFSAIAYSIKQRIYYPAPERIRFRFDDGYFWRYIDTTGYSWYDNRYDANDISPYAAFDSNSSIVTEDFVTKRFTGSNVTAKYGNEGRVILGYQDNRLANELLRTQVFNSFPTGSAQSAQLFTARLEFNIDTSDIITLPSDTLDEHDLPLLRVQIAFKEAGKSVLPFVPFKTSPSRYA